MSALFRSINNFSAKRENAIKEALINTLSENAREILYEVKQNGCEELELCETSSSLCTTLEAIFLHGLKDSFLWQTINVIAGDVSRRPEPNFWSPLLVFLHKQVIEQIQTLSQVTSEVGQCRAWIRLSLNESLFSSYLNNIRKNSSALNPYYKKCALLQDGEALEIASKALEGLEATMQFKLPVNSSLLNQWPDYALQLSGLWSPALKSCPVSSGVDVAGSMQNETMPIATPQPLATNELFAESISNSPFSRAANFGVEDLNQRENLELFLQKVDEMEIIEEEDTAEAKETLPPKQNEVHLKDPKRKSKKKRKQAKENEEHNTQEAVQVEPQDTIGSNADALQGAQVVHGNSLANLMHTSWSSDVNSESGISLTLTNRSTTPTEDGSQHRFFQRSVSMTSSVSSLPSPMVERCSYNALLRKHERSHEVDLTEVWDKFLLQNAVNPTGADPSATEEEGADTQMERDEAGMEQNTIRSRANSDFELVTPSAALDKFDISELREMVQQLCKLPHESGLDVQGFLCQSCQHPLGIGYSKFRVCGFSGYYFCESCMDTELMIIPARIIYNWDFRKYAVSKYYAAFLAEFRSQPFIDLQLLNPDIYNAYEPMAELQSLRIRLNFIRAYLYTCSPASFEELQRQLFGKEYVYEHIHQYSIGDLAMIQRGTLNQQLQKAYKFGEAHVLKCGLCSLKGFICEICQSPRVLYPFHIDTTYRCETCGAVFHAHCLNEHQPCPKCERKRKREDSPLLEAVQDLPTNDN